VTTLAERPDVRRRLRALLQGSGVLAVSIMVMNISTFGFQFVAARMLGPEQYGGVARMMSLLLVISVLQLGLQATAARRVAAEPERVRQIEGTVLTVGLRAALATGAVFLLAAPLVERLLRLDSIVPALLIAVCAVPLTMMGGQAGVLQGERRWRELAVLYLANGVPRLVLGVVAILIRPTEGSAMAAVLLGQAAPVVVGWWALRRGRSAERAPLTPVLTETWHASVALLAFYVLSNLDIILAGQVLDRHSSGLYAAGLIITKMVLFLPQVVVVVAFPAMSTAGQRLRVLLGSVGAVITLGACCMVGSWLFSGLAMLFIGGGKYAGVEDRLPLFALVGTLLAILQLLTYSVLARQHRSAAWLIWAAVAALVVAGFRTDSLPGLVLTVATIDGVLGVLLLGLSLWHLRHDADAARPEHRVGPS